MGFLIENVDEPFAYYLAFALGVGHPCEFREEFCRGIHADYVQAETFIIVEHVFELVFAQHAVVNEYAGQVLAYGAVEKHCRN